MAAARDDDLEQHDAATETVAARRARGRRYRQARHSFELQDNQVASSAA